MQKSSKDHCFEDLKRRILTTDLPPGGDLDEATLSALYGISRTPLREVLQRLAGEGFVRLETNRGAKVASMNLIAMRTFFQTAPMVYANIGRLAAENRTTEQIEDLTATQRDLTAAIRRGDVTAAALSNHAFHHVIGQMAHNPYLMACLERLLIDHTRLSQTFYRATGAEDQARIGTAASQHDALIAAISAAEPDRVIALTLQHWDLSRDRMERFVRPDPLPVDVISQKDPHHAL
ncbi:MAG: GntR family transcriptional regulator [Pseudomonadota bacterium]